VGKLKKRTSPAGAKEIVSKKQRIAETMSDHSHSGSSPLPTYFAVWISLLVGTGLTYYAAKLDLGVFNAAVALIIATTKALLVALFFMHIKGAHEKLLKLVVISTIFFLMILLFLSMADYGTRLWS
jgi:cytochrome c oxidase subunit 4